MMRAVLGLLALLALLQPAAAAAAAPRSFNITHYGAKGDNATVCTRHIAAAFDACAAAGGGQPAGGTRVRRAAARSATCSSITSQ